MNRYVANRILVALLVGSLCLMGYTMMSASADLTGTDGMVTISPDVTITQGNGVNYSFSEVATIDKLEVKSASIEIDDSFEIGAVVSSGYLSNELISYDPSSQIRWIGSCTDSTATVEYTLSGLVAGTTYDIIIDGAKAAISSANSLGTIQYIYTGGWSDHDFIIQKADAPSTGVQAMFEYRIEGDTVYFTDKSYNGPTAWIWNFGDGYGSSDQNPNHKYRTSGVFVISLTVYDADAKSSVATTSIEIALGPDNTMDETDDGWHLWVSDKLTLGISAVGCIVGGVLMYVSSMYVRMPIVTPKGRKVIGILLILLGAYFFIFVDSAWLVGGLSK